MDSRWDDLRYFLASHEAGSFSAAARSLRTEQSTVSRRVAALESELGGALFLRSRGGLVLTARGEAVLPLAQQARRRILELVETAQEAEVRGLVRLALPDGLAAHGLAPPLSALLRQHPGLRLELVTGTAISDLGRREADIAMRFVRPTQPDLVFKRVARLSLGLWGRQELLELPEPPWIGLRQPGPELHWLQEQLGRPPQLTTNGYPGLLALLAEGAGVALIPDVLGPRLGLQRVDLLRQDPPPSELYLVGHAASRRSPRIAAVWSCLEAWAAEQLQ